MADNNPSSISERIVAALLCKGDLSDESLEAEPCPTLELFRFSSRREKWLFFVALLCTALAGFLLPVNQILNGRIADEYLKHPDAKGNDEAYYAVMQIAYFYLAASISLLVLNYVQQFITLTVTDRLVERMRREFLSAVLRLEAIQLDGRGPGEISAMLNENINKIRDGLGEKFGLIIRSSCIFLSSLITAFCFNWKVAAAMSPLGILGAIVTGLSGRFSASSVNAQMEVANKSASFLEEAIMHSDTVAACNGQKCMVKKYRSLLARLTKLGTRVAFYNGFFEGLMFFLIYLFSVIALMIGIPDTFTNSEFTAGSVIISFGSMFLGSYFLGLLGPHMMCLLKARIAAALIYQIIDEMALLEPTPDKPAKRLNGTIEFRNVYFHYPTRNVQILHDLSFYALSGQSVALAGRSGSGKSTTVALLSKLYENYNGEITIDGVDIRQYDKRVIRQNIGIVSQEPRLFNGTIRENIVLGRRWIGKGTQDERLLEVIKIAHADSFVFKFELGLDTLLGEGGVTLSGGQKQRIAIARAIFTDPPILILDEATSALDANSEKHVQQALQEASFGRTTITIAHRLSTLKKADVIFVVDDGMVVEHGRHDRLIRRGGLYAKMAEKQHLLQRKSAPIDIPTTPADPSFSPLSRTSSRSSKKRHRIHPADPIIEIMPPCPSASSSSSFLRLYTHGSLCSILPALLFSILRGFEMPLYTVLMRFVYDALSSPREEYWNRITIAATCSLAIGTFVLLVNTLASCFSGKASEKVMSKVKSRILERVLYQDSEDLEKLEMSRPSIVNDINEHPSALIAGLDSRFVLFVYCMSTLVVCNVLAVVACWQMGLIVIGLSILVFSLLLALFKMLSNLIEKESKEDKAQQLALEIFTEIRTIQIFNIERYFENKYASLQEETKAIRKKSVIIQSLIWSLSNGCIYLFGLTAFGVGCRFVYYGQLTGQELYVVGMAVEFCAYAISFIYPTFPDLIRANAAARILYTYFDLPEEDKSGSTDSVLTGEITVDSLGFAYPARKDQPVLRDLSIAANPGESIALVGSSGCGKSTLISLMERYYTQQHGAILFNGLDHRSINKTALRKQIAVVGQEPILFQGTIADNIRLGSPHATLEDIMIACRKANASCFIEGMPDQYDTEVGGRGRGLSGGQKQRIVIARALLRDPRILILDEATSALDGHSELMVQAALLSACDTCTTVSIAHRLSTIQEARRIYFIDEGRVVEKGNHDQLMALNGKYASYVMAQCLRSDEDTDESS